MSTTRTARWSAGLAFPGVGLYRHPPVDAEGRISAAADAFHMDQMRHCDVPEAFRKDGCEHVMHDHGWIDDGAEGLTVCPGDILLIPEGHDAGALQRRIDATMTQLWKLMATTVPDHELLLVRDLLAGRAEGPVTPLGFVDQVGMLLANGVPAVEIRLRQTASGEVIAYRAGARGAVIR